MKRREIIRQLTAKNIAHDPAAPKETLLGLLNGGAVNRIEKIFNYSGGRGKIKVTFNAAKEDEPAEILICEEIGKDAWTGEGINEKDIRAILDTITPRNRPLNFFINSPGGSVSAGTAIHNVLSAWNGNITKTIIGVAASTASWCIPADTTRAYKNSQVFMHRSMAMTFGNADELRKAIDFLETTDGQIAEMYADQSGGKAEDFLALMKAETLLTGQQAKDLGLVDEIIDGEATNQFPQEWINSAKQKLAALNSLRATPAPSQGENHNKTQENQMKEKIALLNKRGITPPANATEPQLDSLIAQSDAMRTQNTAILQAWNVTIPTDATDAQIVALVQNGKPTTTTNGGELNAADKQVLADLRNQLALNRRREIENAVKHHASAEGGNKIPALEIDNWVNDAVAATDDPVKGNPVLNRLSKLENRAPGVAPINPEISRIDVVNADIRDIARGFEAHNDATKAWQRGNDSISMSEIRNQAVAKAHYFKKVKNRLIEVMNTNTISTELKRQVILQDVVIRDFARRVLGLNLFSTVFRDIPLQGLNTVEVPYYDLDTSASTSFVSGTGYTTIGNTNSSVREITIGEGATNGDRLYQALQFSSQEIARQPYLKIAELAGLKAEKLAFDIWQDILSIVTAANFGAAAVTQPANMFDSDDLADLKAACKAWPEMGRGLLLDSDYDANLLKDPSFKHALNAASDSAIKEGKLFPRVFGFDYAENPNIPTNGENLVGMAVFKYAILVAFAPVPPVDEVRNAGTVWEMITDPATGITLEYRRFGNNVTDVATNVIESSYGFAKGLGSGIKRIVSA